MQRLRGNLMAAIMLCLSLFIFAGCSGGGSNNVQETAANRGTAKDQETSKKHELLGTWKATGAEKGTITFSADGTFKEEGNGPDFDMSGTYTIDTAEKEVICVEKEYNLKFVYHYAISGNNLTLKMKKGLPRKFKKIS